MDLGVQPGEVGLASGARHGLSRGDGRGREQVRDLCVTFGVWGLAGSGTFSSDFEVVR